MEKGKPFYYACLSTGNFNEKTALMYADHTLLTADTRLTGDLVTVFKALGRGGLAKGLEHLVVSPIDSQCPLYT